MIAFERAGLVFIFNLHHTSSFTDYRVGVEVPGEYAIVLSSDEKKFGGWERIDVSASRFFTTPEPWANRANYIQVRLPFIYLILVICFGQSSGNGLSNLALMELGCFLSLGLRLELDQSLEPPAWLLSAWGPSPETLRTLLELGVCWISAFCGRLTRLRACKLLRA